MDGDQRLSHHGQQCHRKAQNPRLRHLHESTLSLGDTAAPCYTSTHTQSYCGRSADGRPLIFHLRDPSFPSQHRSQLDLSNNTAAMQCLLQSHTADVHRPKHITPRADMKVENWARYCSGQAVREVTNPQHPPEYSTTYMTELRPPVGDGSTLQPSGRPTLWHQHDILTGERRQQTDPGKLCRRSRDKLLWAARRRETDCCALRLY
ncbi:hypothetical protein PAMA_009946 [Pampus argenteus]